MHMHLPRFTSIPAFMHVRTANSSYLIFFASWTVSPEKKCSHFLVSVPHFITQSPSPRKKLKSLFSLSHLLYHSHPLVRRGCYCCGCIERCLSFLLRVCERCLVALYQFFELFPSLHFPFLRGMDASAWYESRSAIAVGGVLKHVGAYKRAWFSAACANALMVIRPK